MTRYKYEECTISKAAERLGISVRTVRYHCERGRLGKKIGRDWWIAPEEVEAFDKITRRPGPKPKKKTAKKANKKE